MKNVTGIKPEFDTNEWLKLRDAKLMEWLQDEPAVQFCQIVGMSTELFDDMSDRDVDIEDHQLFNLIFSLWVTLPNNAFWKAYQHSLTPILLMSLNAWLDANKLETHDADPNDRVYAYTFRNLTLQVLPLCVYLLHGEARMRELSLEIHKFFTGHETFEQYLDATDQFILEKKDV